MNGADNRVVASPIREQDQYQRVTSNVGQALADFVQQRTLLSGAALFRSLDQGSHADSHKGEARDNEVDDFRASQGVKTSGDSRGVARVIALIPAEFNAIALVIFWGPTICGMSTWRAGIVKCPHTPPESPRLPGGDTTGSSPSLWILLPATPARRRLADLPGSASFSRIGPRLILRTAPKPASEKADPAATDAQPRRRSGDLVHEVAPGEPLHLHSAHHHYHSEPQEQEVPVSQGCEGTAPPLLIAWRKVQSRRRTLARGAEFRLGEQVFFRNRLPARRRSRRGLRWSAERLCLVSDPFLLLGTWMKLC